MIEMPCVASDVNEWGTSLFETYELIDATLLLLGLSSFTDMQRWTFVPIFMPASLIHTTTWARQLLVYYICCTRQMCVASNTHITLVLQPHLCEAKIVGLANSIKIRVLVSQAGHATLEKRIKRFSPFSSSAILSYCNYTTFQDWVWSL